MPSIRQATQKQTKKISQSETEFLELFSPTKTPSNENESPTKTEWSSFPISLHLKACWVHEMNEAMCTVAEKVSFMERNNPQGRKGPSSLSF